MGFLTKELNDAVRNSRKIYEEKKDGSDDEHRRMIKEMYREALGDAWHQACGDNFKPGGYFKTSYLEGKLKEYSELNHSWSDDGTGLGLKIENEEDVKEVWRNFAKYVQPLEKAKRLSEEYPFLKWDEEEEQRIINEGRISVYARISKRIPYLEKNGLYKELCVLRDVINLIERGQI